MNLTRHFLVATLLSFCLVFVGGTFSLFRTSVPKPHQEIQFGTSEESYSVASRNETNDAEERNKFIAGVRASLRDDPVPAQIAEKVEIPVKTKSAKPAPEPIVVLEGATNVTEIVPIPVTPETVSLPVESTSTTATTAPASVVISEGATQATP